MASEEIEIEIGADGRVTVRTKGIKGEACKDYAAAVATCVGHPKTALTAAEERIAYAESLPKEKRAPNVVEVDFKARKRRT